LNQYTVNPQDSEPLTTYWGTQVDKTDVSIRAGERGPTVLNDFHGREKIQKFDHERIPERIGMSTREVATQRPIIDSFLSLLVHARGAAAHGTFKLHTAIPELTKAGFLTDTSRETPVFLRFSTVSGSRGSADTVRDVRGFAIKFYTEEGNFDMVGNSTQRLLLSRTRRSIWFPWFCHFFRFFMIFSPPSPFCLSNVALLPDIPIFFIQDSIQFPDLVHALKPEPHNEIPQAQTAHDNAWDWMSLSPQSAAMSMWILSDRTIPRSFRMMQGFGIHTWRFINSEGKSTFVKFHFTPELGTHSLVWDEALKLAGVSALRLRVASVLLTSFANEL
jgi:catalase